jgi:hypothetical protein
VTNVTLDIHRKVCSLLLMAFITQSTHPDDVDRPVVRVTFREALDAAYERTRNRFPVDIFKFDQRTQTKGEKLARVWFDGGTDYTPEGAKL